MVGDASVGAPHPPECCRRPAAGRRAGSFQDRRAARSAKFHHYGRSSVIRARARGGVCRRISSLFPTLRNRASASPEHWVRNRLISPVFPHLRPHFPPGDEMRCYARMLYVVHAYWCYHTTRMHSVHALCVHRAQHATPPHG